MRSIKIAAIFGLFLAAAGCQNKVADQNQALYQQTHELQAQLDQARAQQQQRPAADPAEVASLKQQLADRDNQIAQLQAESARPAASVQPSLQGVDTTYDAAANTITATISGDVLFDSGQATLKGSATASLNKIVAAIQKQYPSKMIFVDGHTDSDPITRTKDLWTDNRDLSYARAKAVATYLISNGIDTKLITIRAFGENEPKATKAASRRVEIVVSLNK
jgi:flagellar motor protein MotB